jgi:hypothetical protein
MYDADGLVRKGDWEENCAVCAACTVVPCPGMSQEVVEWVFRYAAR